MSRSVYLNQKPIVNPFNQVAENGDFVLDNEWAHSAFLISDIHFNEIADVNNRYWSSADAKFTDGRLGCNIGINARPQFTRYTDTRSKGRNKKRNDVTLGATEGNFGMGRYYSEAIDDPSQTIYMRFGVPQFTGIASFFSRAYDNDMLTLARTGRATSFLYKGAKAIGMITSVAAFPQIAAGVLLGKAVSFVFSKPTSKFYSMKPTMHMYWSTVNTFVNNVAVARGLFPKILNPDANKGENLGQPYTLDQEYLNELARLMPDIFGGPQGADVAGKVLGNNNFDIYAIANRAQRIANLAFTQDYETLKQGEASDFVGFLKKELSGDGTHSTYIVNSAGERNLVAMLNDFFMFSDYKADASAAVQEIDPKSFPDKENDAKGNEVPGKMKDPSWITKAAQHFDSEFRDGSQFAVFKVDFTGSVSESFANSVQESDLSNKLNGQVSDSRRMRFTFAEGNMTDSVIEKAIGSVVGAAADIATGALDGLTMGFSNVLRGLGGSGFIDIPKHWQSSSANLARSTYKMKLISPYGNVISQMQNIYIPLAMILSAALPLSTGKASYTSPYLCQLFDRGRCQIKLGMIESLQIERGTSNLAFSTRGNPMAIDVTFSIVDLSSIMHMPISSGGLFETDTNLDEDNIMSDYIAVLAGQDLYSQFYAIPKAKMKLAKALVNFSKVTSPAFLAASAHEALAENFITGPFLNVIEGMNRGNALIGGPIQK